MSMNMQHLLARTTSLALLGLAAIPLSAIPGMAHASVLTVKVGDLDLRRAENVRILDGRIRLVSDQLCHEQAPQPVTAISSCVQAVKDEVYDKLSPTQQDEVRYASRPSGKSLLRL